jgi:hypothetical protein
MTRLAPLLVLAAAFLPGSALAQTPPGPTTQVLVTLTVKPDVDRARLRQTLPQEVRDTVKLYLDGRIQQWFSRSDGTGVVFLLSAASVDEARAAMEALPLARSGLASLDYVALGPLRPLALLIGPPPGDAGAGAQK